MRERGIEALRRIDRVTGAKPVFVVSGIPGSVGSAARDVWRGLLPFLGEERRGVALWPFEGTVAELAVRGGVVVGEIYPRVAYAVAVADGSAGERRLEPLSKNLREVRRRALERLRRSTWVKTHGVRLREADLGVALGSADAFDALMAAAALLRCVLAGEALSVGEDGVAEGGILGSGAVVLRSEIVTSPGSAAREDRGRGGRSGKARDRSTDSLATAWGARISSLPTISVFYGIVIQMFWRDHAPPHFHALYAEHEVLIGLRNLQVLRGSLPRRAMALVLEWATHHRAELMEDWTLCSQLRPPRPIEPLK